MKTIFLFLLLCTSSVWSQSVFERANSHYQEGNYQQAIKDYHSILKDQKHSSELYYNLANAYLKTNTLGEAIYYYEKALQLNPKNEDARNNLRIAELRRVDEFKTLEKVGFKQLIYKFSSILTTTQWALLCTACSFLILALFIGYYYSSKTTSKRNFFIGLFIAPFLSLVAFSAATYQQSAINNEKVAIIMPSKVTVKLEPKENANDAFPLHEGTKVYIIETVGNWHLISLSDGSKGWIEKSQIRVI